MKKTLVLVFVASAFFLASCGDSGKKAKTEDAKKVEVVKEASSVEFKTIKEGSHLEWRAAHLGGLEPRFGQVSLKSADVSAKDGKLATAKIIMDIASLTVTNFPDDKEKEEKLTGHLKTADFFNVEKFPTSTFEVTKVEDGTGDFNSKVTGNLTIMGVTKSITFSANVKVTDTDFSVKSEDFTIDRKDFGLLYNTEGTEGVPANYLIADEVGFTINVNLTK